jgi:hypothetical protein
VVGLPRSVSLKWCKILACLRNFNYGICCFEFGALSLAIVISIPLEGSQPKEVIAVNPYKL